MIRFREAKMEGGFLMIKPLPEDIGAVKAFLYKIKNRLYELEIKEHRQKRSLNANAYAWALIGKLAKEIGITPNEVYIHAVRGQVGNYEIKYRADAEVAQYRYLWSLQGLGWPCVDMGPAPSSGYRELWCYYGSSTYDSKQMAMLIDSLVQECRELGIETMDENKLASLLESWQGQGKEVKNA